MADKLQGIWQQVLNEYPRLAEYGIQVGRGPEGNNRGGGYLEFYPPDEKYNPRPGAPFIEVYEKAMGEDLGKMLLGDALHYAPEVDEKIRGMKESFRESLTPEQLSLSRQRYRDYTTPSSRHYNPNESRSYQDWFETSDLDAILRGGATGQWPESSYTPRQKILIRSILGHLKGN